MLVLFLACVSRSELADAGEHDLYLSYTLDEAGPTDVSAHVGFNVRSQCVTLDDADMTFSGETMDTLEAGSGHLSAWYMIPVTDCDPPEYALELPEAAFGDPLEVVLADDSAEWRAADEELLALTWVSDPPSGATVAPGTMVLLDPPMRQPEYTGLSVDGNSLPRSASFRVPFDQPPGTFTVEALAAGAFQPETCEGFAECTVHAQVTTTLTFHVAE